MPSSSENLTSSEQAGFGGKEETSTLEGLLTRRRRLRARGPDGVPQQACPRHAGRSLVLKKLAVGKNGWKSPSIWASASGHSILGYHDISKGCLLTTG